jgi:hypothetical protein
MKRYADPSRCPDCGSDLVAGALSCPSCALPLSGPVAAQLFATLTEADRLLARLRSPASTAAAAPGPLPVHEHVGKRERRSWLTTASVPQILFTLGAACLLIAAIVFLAVNWAALGVNGRTTVLVAMTLVVGGLATWFAHQGLRGALESLGLVALGLFTLDLVGADNADWFGALDFSTLLVVIGAAVNVVSIGAVATVERRTSLHFRMGEAVQIAAAGALTTGLATLDALEPEEGLAIALLLTLTLAQVCRALHLALSLPGSAIVALATWVGLVARGAELAADEPTWRGLWLDFSGWPLLLAVAIPWLARAAPGSSPRLGHVLSGLGGTALSVLLWFPAYDESADLQLLALLALLAAVGFIRTLPSAPAAEGAALPLVVAVVPTLFVTMELASFGLYRLQEVLSIAWTGALRDTLPSLDLPSEVPDPSYLGLTVAVLVGVAATQLRRSSGTTLHPRTVIGIIALGAWLGAIPLTVSAWPLVTAALVMGVGFVAEWWIQRDHKAIVWAAAFLAGANDVALFSEGLSLVSLGATVVLAGTVMNAVHSRGFQIASGTIAIAAVAAWIWTYGAVNGDAPRGTVLIALSTIGCLVVLHAAFSHRGTVNSDQLLGLELGGLASSVVLLQEGVRSAPADSQPTWLAAYLTVVGASTVAVALIRPEQRRLAWFGTLVLATATWIRMWDLGVDTPEAYTLPWAILLILLGTLRTHSGSAGTLMALGPGLGLALLPSLLWALDDPETGRSLVLGMACFVLVVLGAKVRWAAPLVYGAAVGLLLALRLGGPYVSDAVPRWALLGAAGVVLVALAVTWEKRLRDARTSLTYLRRLR